MGLITQRSEGGSQIPSGEKVRFGIKSAAEDWGQHGPQVKFELRVLAGEHEGATIFDWASLTQPRLDFVKALRNKDYTDEKIAEILRERGYDFEDIDEPEEELMIADGGKLFNIAMACFDGQTKVINSFDTIDELLDALVGRSFMSITKRRSKSGDYIGITWDMIYTDPEATFDDIPF